MALLSGSQLGAYRIVGPLGAGGMGEVYRAHDPRLARDVALKVLPPDMAGDASRLERFTREARAIAALNHPHIITIYSTEETDGVRFLTMELVEGQSLDTLVVPAGLPLARFLELALPLADALTAAHQKQITHRDLKPANVMVASDGRVKVLDFGLARVSGPQASHQTIEATRPVLTSEGTIVGTMPYMSPEQIEGRPLDHRTDLFSLGVMFHEMLTGARPFGGESSPQLMSSILRDTPSSASDIRTDVPEALSRLIHRCLEKRPDDRVQTARDVYNELKHVQKQLESGSVRARSDSGSGRVAVAESAWIAVLPFTTRTADPDSQALAAGLTEDITSGLALFPSLSVVALHSARSFKDSPLDARQIAERLNARYIICGSVRKSAAGVRIVVHLIDAHSGTQLWGETYDRGAEHDDIYAVQDDLTDRIVATVADVHGVLMRSMSQDVTALGLDDADPRVLRFHYWTYQRQHTAVKHSQLRDAFEQAVAREPGVASFWAALAHLYWHEHSFAYNVRPSALERSREAATRALDLDPLLQHAWEALAATCFFEHDREAFTHAQDRALALNPRNANAMALAGILLVHADELDRGVALTDRAMALNPDHPGWYHMARANRDYAVGDDEGALRAAKRINMPDHVWAHVLIALAAGQLGRSGDATAALDAVFRLAPPFADEAVVVERSRQWKWNPAHVERMLDGYRKATALHTAARAGRGQAVHRASDAGTHDAGTGRAHDAGTGRAWSTDRASSTEVAPSTGHVPEMLTRAGSFSGPAPAIGPSPPTEAGALAIAVHLFSSRGSHSSAELAEGLTEDVTTGLARFSYLRVVPRAANTAAAVPARYVLGGQVRVAQSAVRVSARLTDTVSGAHLWAENYDRPVDAGVFALQDDIAPRIIATVGDANGVLLRSMAATLKQRPIDAHTVSDLVLRFHGFLEHFDPAEHLQLRDRLIEALRHEPGHADGWACLSSLIEHEYSHGLNPQPDSLSRARDTAERSVATDPVCQEGWRGMASAAFFARDAASVRIAAERAIAINPLNTGTVAVCGMFLAYSGAWDRGLDVIRQAMQPNPHYPGWVHFPFCSYHFQRGDYTTALQHVKQVNMPRFPKWYLTIAAVAGQMGSRDDARAALDALSRLDPASGDDEYARRAFASWTWTDDEMERLIDGVRKARALVASAIATPPAIAKNLSETVRTQDVVAREPVRTAERDSSSAAVRGRPISGSSTAHASIAVLPFTDLSEDRNQEWFCDGIAEEILNALTQLSGVHVAARTSAFSLRHTAADLRVVGEKLGVTSVVQGSVRRAGDRIRVTVQLVDAASGFQLWSDRYDRELKDIFDVQDEIARAVASRLSVASATKSGARLVTAATSNLEAYDHYLKGRALLYRRGASILPALEHFRQAVELDADYSLAWAGIADAYVVSAYFGHVRGTEARRHGLAAARRALALDPSSPDAHTALAGLAQICQNDLEAARAGYETALELNPSHIPGRCWYALFYLQAGRGRYADGVAQARRARELDPLSAYVATILAVALVTAGDVQEAVQEARRATALDPLSFVARWVLGLSLRYAGCLDEAEATLEEAAATSGRHQFAIVSLALTCAQKGQPDRAAALHAELVQRATASYIPLTQLALTADAVGDRDQALAYARQALDQREPPFALLSRHWPEFRELRQDPRFVAMLREMDVPWPVDDDR